MKEDKGKNIRIDVAIDFTEYIAGIIDAPLEEFSKTIERDRVPVGVLLNVRGMLIGMFDELVRRKNALIDRIKKGEFKIDEDMKGLYMGIYNEMQKIEDKVVYLNNRIAEIMESTD